MKKILIPIFVVLALGLCYLYYNNSIGTSTTSLVSQNETTRANSGAIVVGAEIISLLDRLDAIKLDTSLFSEATFQSLKDFSIVLRSQAVGRPNPFAAIGTDTSASSQNSSQTPTVPSAQIQTNAPASAAPDESSGEGSSVQPDTADLTDFVPIDEGQ